MAQTTPLAQTQIHHSRNPCIFQTQAKIIESTKHESKQIQRETMVVNQAEREKQRGGSVMVVCGFERDGELLILPIINTFQAI